LKAFYTHAQVLINYLINATFAFGFFLFHFAASALY